MVVFPNSDLKSYLAYHGMSLSAQSFTATDILAEGDH